MTSKWLKKRISMSAHLYVNYTLTCIRQSLWKVTCKMSVLYYILFYRENGMEKKISLIKGRIEDVNLPVKKVRSYGLIQHTIILFNFNLNVVRELVWLQDWEIYANGSLWWKERNVLFNDALNTFYLWHQASGKWQFR